MLTPARLDKVTIYGFRIAAINKMRDLVRRNIVTIKQGVKLYCRTENDRYFSSIRIEATDAFDYFAYGITPDGMEYGILELSVPDRFGYHNLYGMTTDECRDQLQEAALCLEEEYGIVLDFTDAKYKKMEINKTIRLDGAFDMYHRPLALIMYLLPGTLRLGGEHDVYRKDADHTGLQERRVKTYYKSSGKKGITIKIYDKSEQLKNVHNVKLDGSFLRFEITLNCADKIKKALGSNRVKDIDDAAIQKYLDDFVIQNLASPYEAFKVKEKKLIRRLLKKNYKPASRTWVRNTLLEICSMEIDKKLPVILDIKNLTKMLNILPFQTRQSRYNAKKNFESACREHAPVLCQNDDERYEELLRKLL